MQNPADADQTRAGHTIKQQMPWPMHSAVSGWGMVLAMAQMKAAHRMPKLWSRDATEASWIGGNVAKAGHEQGLVALPGSFAEAILRIGKEVDDVFFGGRRQPIDRHRLAPGFTDPVARQHAEAANQVLQIIVLQVAVATLVEIRKTHLCRLLQGF